MYKNYAADIKKVLEEDHQQIQAELNALSKEFSLIQKQEKGLVKQKNVLNEKYRFFLEQIKPDLLNLIELIMTKEIYKGPVEEVQNKIKQFKDMIEKERRILSDSILVLFREDFKIEEEKLDNEKFSLDEYNQLVQEYRDLYRTIKAHNVEIMEISEINVLLSKLNLSKLDKEGISTLNKEIYIFKSIKEFMVFINDLNKELADQLKNCNNLNSLLNGICRTGKKALPFLHLFIQKFSTSFSKELDFFKRITDYENFKKSFFTNLVKYEKSRQAAEERIEQLADKAEKKLEDVGVVDVHSFKYKTEDDNTPYYVVKSTTGQIYFVYPIVARVYKKLSNGEKKQVNSQSLLDLILKRELMSFVNKLRAAAIRLESKIESIINSGEDYRIIIPTMGAISLYVVMRFFARSIDEERVFYMPASASIRGVVTAVEKYFYNLFQKLSKENKKIHLFLIDEIVGSGSSSRIIGAYNSAFSRFMTSFETKKEYIKRAKELRQKIIINPLKGHIDGEYSEDVASSLIKQCLKQEGINKQPFVDFIKKLKNKELSFIEKLKNKELPSDSDNIERKFPKSFGMLFGVIGDAAKQQLDSKNAKNLSLDFYVIGIHDIKTRIVDRSLYRGMVNKGQAKQFNVLRIVTMDIDELDIAKYKKANTALFRTEERRLKKKFSNAAEVDLIRVNNDAFFEYMDKILRIVEERYPQEFKRLVQGKKLYVDLSRILKTAHL